MIYHITTPQAWDLAQQQGAYSTASLATEGFIHCSTQQQVAAVVTRYYQNEPNLLLLHIDEATLTSELKWELSPSVNELFPHIFGTINLDAIVEVAKYK